MLVVDQKFTNKIHPEPNTGCWLWAGATNRDGYGIAHRRRQTRMAHSLSYEFACGPVPDGLELDHLCRVRCCVNPNHLQAVTHLENCRRGTAGTHIRRVENMKTHCSKGHEFSGDNLYTRKNGARGCRECVRIASRKYSRKIDMGYAV